MTGEQPGGGASKPRQSGALVKRRIGLRKMACSLNRKNFSKHDEKIELSLITAAKTQ